MRRALESKQPNPGKRLREGGPGFVVLRQCNARAVQEITHRRRAGEVVVLATSNRAPAPAFSNSLKHSVARGRTDHRDLVPTAMVSLVISVCQLSTPAAIPSTLRAVIIGNKRLCDLPSSVQVIRASHKCWTGFPVCPLNELNVHPQSLLDGPDRRRCAIARLLGRPVDQVDLAGVGASIRISQDRADQDVCPTVTVDIARRG